MTSNVVSVGLLTTYIRQLFETDALLGDVWVEGEVSEVFVSRAGHVYFTLRDAESQIKSVLFRGMAQRQRTLPAVGDRVAVHGHVTTYERDGVYQLYVDVVEHAGQGLLALQFERLRQKLESEGLFDESRKRPLPPTPRVIAVVTSAEGAVWHDVQTVMRRRYPMVHLLLAAAPVQGDGAPDGIVAALERIQNDGRADLVIVARGGGAAEDLACFNDERVARAVFACRVPVVSAIGHETDWTIIDLVADLRAPTPSVAAELCTPLLSALCDEVRDGRRRARTEVDANIRTWRELASDLGRRVQLHAPLEQVRARRTEVEHLRAGSVRSVVSFVGDRRGAVAESTTELGMSLGLLLSDRRHRAEQRAAVLAALDPMRVLERGYAAIETVGRAQPVVNAGSLESGTQIRARFADGSAVALVQRVDVQNGVGQNGS